MGASGLENTVARMCMDIPGDETKGFNSIFKVQLASFSTGEGFPQVRERLSLDQRGFLSVWVVRWVNTASSPRALELLAQAPAMSQTSLVTPLQS